MSKKVLVILTLIIMSLTLAVGCSKDESNRNENEVSDNTNTQTPKSNSEEVSYSIEVGKAAPNFTLKDLDGNAVSLNDYKGKTVFINFWATTCGYCRKEMPDLQKLSSENDDLVILAVDVMESKSTVDKFIKENGYTFPVLLDEDGKVASTYLVSGFPTAYFVDKDGTLLGRSVGLMDYDQMNNILKDVREGTLKVGE